MGVAALFQRDAHEGLQAEADLGRIQQRHVLADDAGGFQLLQAAQAGRRRQGHLFRQFHVGQPAIGLQCGQHFYICLVQGCRRHVIS
ncbi:hypothetical protein D3C85_1547220 [compost metagenome]